MVAVGGDRTTLPDSAGRSPARVRNSVDLPAPFTPTSPTTPPGATTRSRSEKRTRAPCPAARPRATSVALKRTPGGSVGGVDVGYRVASTAPGYGAPAAITRPFRDRPGRRPGPGRRRPSGRASPPGRCPPRPRDGGGPATAAGGRS